MKELRQSLGRAQASMHQMLHVECPKCQKVVTQANKMLCVFPCGCGMCQRCFDTKNKDDNQKLCPMCGVVATDFVIDQQIARRLEDPDMDFEELTQRVYALTEDIEQLIENTEKL